MVDFSERAALCALNRIFGYYPSSSRRLLELYGSASEVMGTPGEEVARSLREGRECAAQIGPDALRWAEQELEKTADEGGRFVCYGDDDYPALLAECPDAPLGIYSRCGSSLTEALSMRPCVGIVGTRDMSPYGKEWCRKIVSALADTEAAPVIVSGLAFGIDATAHTAALDFGLPTVGVMATGIDTVYPWRHSSLAKRMLETPGCALVTDYPLGSSPLALNFIRRNRIIAGLCFATVVIESRSKGGSLITAKYAADYNRDVYALPGRADDIRSRGCNSLIRSHMADIITDPYGLAEQMGLRVLSRRKKADLLEEIGSRYGSRPDFALLRDICLLIKDNRGISVEELCQRTSLGYGSLMGLTGILESDGFIATDLLGRCSIVTKKD